jgi:nucleotide-binding universal stress UspA family protein
MKGKILVPVDFSTHTLASCHYALSLASSLNMDVLLFHSFFDQIYFSDGGFSTGFETGIMMTDELILDFYKQKEARMEEIANVLRDSAKKEGNPEISVLCHMESGDPEVMILRIIAKEEPRMIIMGSSGMGRKNIFAGSVARRLMDHTNIPVIAVPDADLPANVSDIAYMTNFESFDAIAITEIDALFSPLPVSIHCVHLCLSKDDAEVHEAMESLSGKEIPSRPGTTVSFNVISGNESERALAGFFAKNNINLIAFIPHKRNVFKNLLRQNITKEDLFQTLIPIMAIPSR